MSKIIVKNLEGTELKAFSSEYYMIKKGTDYVTIINLDRGHEVMSIPVSNVCYIHYDDIVIKN